MRSLRNLQAERTEELALADVRAIDRIPAGDARLAVDAGLGGERESVQRPRLAKLGRFALVFAGGVFGAGFARLEIPAGKVDEVIADCAAVLALVDRD